MGWRPRTAGPLAVNPADTPLANDAFVQVIVPLAPIAGVVHEKPPGDDLRVRDRSTRRHRVRSVRIRDRQFRASVTATAISASGVTYAVSSCSLLLALFGSDRLAAGREDRRDRAVVDAEDGIVGLDDDREGGAGSVCEARVRAGERGRRANRGRRAAPSGGDGYRLEAQRAAVERVESRVRGWVGTVVRDLHGVGDVGGIRNGSRA